MFSSERVPIKHIAPELSGQLIAPDGSLINNLQNTLQNALQNLEDRTDQWGLELASDKTTAIDISVTSK